MADVTQIDTNKIYITSDKAVVKCGGNTFQERETDTETQDPIPSERVNDDIYSPLFIES